MFFLRIRFQREAPLWNKTHSAEKLSRVRSPLPDT